MDSELILKSIARHIALEPREEEIFLKLLQPLKIKRKQFLLHRGEVCRHAVFVNSGCLRGYTIDANGFEHILSFAPTGWWIADMYSYITQEGGYLNIDALEDAQVLQLSKEHQESLFAQVPKFERYYRIITEKSLVSYQLRTLDNLSLTAQDRYLNFCRRYPSLINSIPQKYIASYIGVTPEFLSKMRKDMQKQGLW
ncbi:Crp/Fnr family transcriptional regulator [Cesiribacter sp. SM1]|uniref:Crp/Fnr family transcriptional regulator n=1 Tax=Cesiribacter sp. SM1 TaxID=2861196 RepID=UPI001CD52179|nr:Crp/Fnr family transcriptional regulator [Cesiribacter sp. SM1]